MIALFCLDKFEILNNQPITVRFEDSKKTGHLMDDIIRFRVKNLRDWKQDENPSKLRKPSKLYKT